MRRYPYPSALVTTGAVAATILLWGALRLWFFSVSLLPLTFVLPLMLCVWTRRRWQLWGMVAMFTLMIGAKIYGIPSMVPAADQKDAATLLSIWYNIVLGAAAVHGILVLRDRVDATNEEIFRQNAELEVQAAELAQQNQEMRAQAEELAQQNKEIESQAAELATQNEQLQAANQRLASREEVLQAVVESSRQAGGARIALEEVSRRALAIVGAPAAALTVIELQDGKLQAIARTTQNGKDAVRETWKSDNALVAQVLKLDKTVEVDDLRDSPELSASFGAEEIYRSVLATPIRAAGGQVGVLVVSSTEPAHWNTDQFRLIEWAAAQCGLILESLRWQEALQQRAAAIEAANRSKDEFLAMLSHELRTPLTPVLIAASNLERDTRLPPHVREDLVMIRRNVAVQSRLIDDLLDLTRISRGKLDLNQQALDIGTLLRETAAMVAPELDQHHQTLTLEINLPSDICVIGDGARLQQVFWNLLKNGIKFSPPQGRIRVIASAVGASRSPESSGKVIVQISDNGVGISPADIERIFLPFEQAAIARRRGGNAGLGLGLSIAKAIAELHDGSIRASSDGPGTGATFTIELPLAVPTPPIAAPAAVDRAVAPGKPAKSGPALRILLVEDHVDTGRVMARLLTALGYSVVHAENVTTAIAYWQSQPFDLLISDLGLPDGSGLDLMRQIREITPGIPGICMSGFGMESDVRASREAGFFEHLIKPVDMQRLQAAIRRATAPAAVGSSRDPQASSRA